MFALHFRNIAHVARWAAICTISVAACCSCSREKTSAAKSGYKPAGEKAKTVPVAKSTVTGSKQDASFPPASSHPDSSSRRSNVSEAERVQDDVRAFQTAFYDGNIDVVLEYTHPRIFELLRGQENAKIETSAVLSKVKSIGMKLESLTFPTPPVFMKSEANEFVIVPTLSVVSAKGTRVESLNYQVGNREVGTSKWTYIEGTRVNKKNLKQYFLDFPADYEFPQIYRKKL